MYASSYLMRMMVMIMMMMIIIVWVYACRFSIIHEFKIYRGFGSSQTHVSLTSLQSSTAIWLNIRLFGVLHRVGSYVIADVSGASVPFFWGQAVLYYIIARI
jgi:hypothetical protein